MSPSEKRQAIKALRPKLEHFDDRVLNEIIRSHKSQLWRDTANSILQRRVYDRGLRPHTIPKNKARPSTSVGKKNLNRKSNSKAWTPKRPPEGRPDVHATLAHAGQSVSGHQHSTTSAIPVEAAAFWKARGVKVRSFANPAAVPVPYPDLWPDDDGSSGTALPSTVAGCSVPEKHATSRNAPTTLATMQATATPLSGGPSAA